MIIDRKKLSEIVKDHSSFCGRVFDLVEYSEEFPYGDIQNILDEFKNCTTLVDNIEKSIKNLRKKYTVSYNNDNGEITVNLPLIKIKHEDLIYNFGKQRLYIDLSEFANLSIFNEDSDDPYIKAFGWTGYHPHFNNDFICYGTAAPRARKLFNIGRLDVLVNNVIIPLLKSYSDEDPHLNIEDLDPESGICPKCNKTALYKNGEIDYKYDADNDIETKIIYHKKCYKNGEKH